MLLLNAGRRLGRKDGKGKPGEVGVTEGGSGGAPRGDAMRGDGIESDDAVKRVLSAGGAEERRTANVLGEKEIGEDGRGEYNDGEVLGLEELEEDVMTEMDVGRGLWGGQM